MRFGTKCPPGFLPIFSVNTEAEARALLTLACPMTDDGAAYFVPELAAHQTLDNLYAFGERLRGIYVDRMGRPNDPPPAPPKRPRAARRPRA